MPDLPNLLIVSHVRHYSHDGKLYAYAPYAREIDIWADLFPELRIAAPCQNAAPSGDCAALTRSNISVVPLPETGGTTLQAKIHQLFRLPAIVWRLRRAMRWAGAIHVRCPGNVGLIGVLLAPLYSRRLVAKFAGQWDAVRGEAVTVRLQKRILASRWWKGPTTVYGRHSGQPKKVVSFFTSMLDSQQMEMAQAAAAARREIGKLRVLFVGRLSRSKNVECVLRAVALAKSEGTPVEAVIAGEGPEEAALKALCHDLRVTEDVQFHGGISFDRVLQLYSDSHVLVLASETEGWPKVVAEAMAFGVICIASDRGFLREMLGDGRGILIHAGDSKAIASAFSLIAHHPESFDQMRRKAAQWSREYSLEGLRDALADLLSKCWGISFTGRSGQMRAAAR